jgi:hypothetical protein
MQPYFDRMTDGSRSLPVELDSQDVCKLHDFMNSEYVGWCMALPERINKERYLGMRLAFVSSRYGQDMEIELDDRAGVHTQAKDFSRRTRFGQLRYINVAIAAAFE